MLLLRRLHVPGGRAPVRRTIPSKPSKPLSSSSSSSSSHSSLSNAGACRQPRGQLRLPLLLQQQQPRNSSGLWRVATPPSSLTPPRRTFAAVRHGNRSRGGGGEAKGIDPQLIIVLLRVFGRVFGTVLRIVRARGLDKSYPRLIGGLLLIPLGIGGTYLACHVSQSPYTGRLQLLLLDHQSELDMGATAASQVLKQEQGFVLPNNAPETLVVHGVCVNLVRALEPLEQEAFDWEISVIESDVANAFVVPGGKIFVYTGLLKQVQTSAALAFILGHEISHAMARHGVEKLGVFALTGLIIEGIAGFVGLEQHRHLERLLLPMIQSFVVDRPYSRGLETEADSLGLRLMARAGYDPQEAVESWKRMQAGGGKETMELLSTHPSHSSRITALQKQMPEALRIQREALQRMKAKGLPPPDSFKQIKVVTSISTRVSPSILQSRREQSARMAAQASSLVVVHSE